MSIDVLIATSNQGKLQEINRILNTSAKTIRLFSLADFNLSPHPDEKGPDFEAISIRKSLYYSNLEKNILVVAEDSGLVVEALNGAPGIYSSRYAGKHATDILNINKLLKELIAVKNRRACFVSVLALSMGPRVIKTFTGEVWGEILDLPRGKGGFGYDPVFYYPPWQKTFGQVTQEKKNTVSHRKMAFEKLIKFL